MTLQNMKELDREWLTVAEAADVLGTSPQRLRDQLDIDDDLPVDRRKIRFPHIKIASRHHISRLGFIRWITGEMMDSKEPEAIRQDSKVSLLQWMNGIVDSKEGAAVRPDSDSHGSCSRTIL